MVRHGVVITVVVCFEVIKMVWYALSCHIVVHRGVGSESLGIQNSKGS